MLFSSWLCARLGCFGLAFRNRGGACYARAASLFSRACLPRARPRQDVGGGGCDVFREFGSCVCEVLLLLSLFMPRNHQHRRQALTTMTFMTLSCRLMFVCFIYLFFAVAVNPARLCICVNKDKNQNTHLGSTTSLRVLYCSRVRSEWVPRSLT